MLAKDQWRQPTSSHREGHGSKLDVDFSLALHNRTGKYFVGRDILADIGDRVEAVRYWRLASRSTPRGLGAKLLGRAMAAEIDVRWKSRLCDSALPSFQARRPVLHLDPFTVLFHRLGPRDFVLCHDLGPLSHPHLFPPGIEGLYRAAYAKIAQAGPHMAFVSRASQKAFHDLAPGRFAASRVIYPAVRAGLGGNDEQTAVAGVGRSFLLTVGNVGERKNQRRCIQAFARSGLAARGVQYVICGGREPGYEAVAALAQTPGVRLLNYVSDQELNWLYAHAAGFVLPSLLEGFGSPVAEAIFRGLAPLVSRDSVLEEVAGSGGLSADPQDEAEMADAMVRLIAMPADERERRQTLLLQSAGRFTRERFARAWRAFLLDGLGEGEGMSEAVWALG